MHNIGIKTTIYDCEMGKFKTVLISKNSLCFINQIFIKKTLCSAHAAVLYRVYVMCGHDGFNKRKKKYLDPAHVIQLRKY